LSLTHFIKHFECETKKSSQKHNEHQENSSLLNRRLKNDTSVHLQEFTLKHKINTALQVFHRILVNTSNMAERRQEPKITNTEGKAEEHGRRNRSEDFAVANTTRRERQSAPGNQNLLRE
jgi:hypothetical protein